MTAICYCTAPATTGQLCTEHLARLEQNLRRTPGILVELDVTITNQAKQGGASGTGERMAFNETASDRRQDVVVVLRSAAHAAAPQVRHRYAETPADLVARTIEGIHQLARSVEVHTIAQDLDDALRSAVQVMDCAQERRVLGACHCGNLVTTTRTEGAVRCQSCEAVYDVSEWDQLRRDLALTHEATVTELAGYFTRDLKAPITVRTLQRWAAREEITAVQGSEPARYRIADVVAAWERIKGRELPGRAKKASEAVHAC